MKISVKHEDFTTISLSGSISSANIQEFENAAANEPGNAEGVIIDAAELEYISSAGLRVLLSLKKRCGKKPLRIINVNDEVMNIFDCS